MNGNPHDKLKDIFPSTPAAFTRHIERAVAALQERGARWRLSAPAIAGYAAAVCGVAALLIFGRFTPGTPVEATHTSAAPAPTPMATPAGVELTAATIPPLEPLPQLTVTENIKAPAALDGWQAVALSGDVTWYYHAASFELACTKGESTHSIALAPKGAQTVDPTTFIPDPHNRWMAFTVHEPEGDTVWVVTAEGAKMVVPDDIYLINVLGDACQADFKGCEMAPVGEETLYGVIGEGTENEKDGVMINATLADGSVYRLDVSLGTVIDGQAYNINDRRAVLHYTGIELTGEQQFVAFNSLLYPITKGDDGSYLINMGQYRLHTQLNNNRLRLFKGNLQKHLYDPSSISLFIYKDDPDSMLYELDMNTGKTVPAVGNCLSAGWVDNNMYWYVTGDDPTAIHTRPAAIAGGVMKLITWDAYSDSAGMGINRLEVHVAIQNNTDESIQIPVEIPCELNISVNGKTFWEVDGQYAFSDAKMLYVFSPEGEGISVSAASPITLPAGYTLDFMMIDVPCTEEGVYAINGLFYDDIIVDSVIELPFQYDYLTHGVSATGKADKDGRLSITIDNRSLVSYMIPPTVDATGGTNLLYPAMIFYRLYNGEEMVDRGILQMSKDTLTADERTVASGKSHTLTEQGNTPRFSNLPAGNYHVDWTFSYVNDINNADWSWQETDHFDFTAS